MLTKLEGENYILATDKYDRYPTVVNKDKLDYWLAKMEDYLESIGDAMIRLYDSEDEDDNAVYHILNSCMYDKFEDGRNYQLGDMIGDIISLRANLESDDDITPVEDLWTLEDEGYSHYFGWGGKYYYQKVIEDSKEREVVEEIWLDHRKPRRRLRTTIWEQIDGNGKSSEDIRYEDLPIDENLAKIIDNTINRTKAND